jgi:hypothetical protein
VKATFGDWVSYYLENTLTASPYMQLVFLGVIVGIIIFVFGLIYNGGAHAPSVASQFTSVLPHTGEYNVNWLPLIVFLLHLRSYCRTTALRIGLRLRERAHRRCRSSRRRR